jgi:hypothetical protein
MALAIIEQRDRQPNHRPPHRANETLPASLQGRGLGTLAVLVLQRIGVVLPGVLNWAGLPMTGVHPTLTGAGLGLTTPMPPKADG